MLLLIFSNCYGAFYWSGPSASRTARVDPEIRVAKVPVS